MSDRGPQPIGADVKRQLARFGPQAGMAELVGAWPDAVGPSIASNAWPARIARDGTLHVHTASAAWAFELGQLAQAVLEQLRASLGEAAPPRLRFAVGPLPADREETADPPAPEPVRAGPQERAAAAELTAGIADDGLRLLVSRAAAASLARGSSDRSF